MIQLNGKAKEKFLEWLSKTYDLIHYDTELWFKNEKEITQNAFVIDWFDSVGIYINTTLDETNKHKFKYLITDINTRHLHCWKEGVNKDSRQEAIKKAIKKANDIYNARFK